MPPTVDIYSLAAKPIEMFFNNVSLGIASSFTWTTSELVYLVTNWHNITGINPITGEHLHSQGGEPNRLVVQIDLADYRGGRGPIDVALYDKQGRPVWLEHPLRQGIDVVAILLPGMPGGVPHPVNLMPTDPMAVHVGMDAFIISDTHSGFKLAYFQFGNAPASPASRSFDWHVTDHLSFL